MTITSCAGSAHRYRALVWGLLCGLVVALSTAAVSGTEKKAPWLQDDVVAAAMAIGMTPDQQPRFGSAISAFLEKYNNEVNEILRRKGRDLGTQIERRLIPLTNQLDAEMANVLTADQMPAFAVYRDLLCDRLLDVVLADTILIQ